MSSVKNRARKLWTILILASGLAVPGRGGQAGSEAGRRLFAERIGPLFRERCQTCHAAEMKNASLDVSTREALLRGGDNGPAVVPGNAKASLLYKLMAHEQEPHMPYKSDKLPADIIALVAEWINDGAPYDKVTAPEVKPAIAADAGLKLFSEHVRSVLERQCFTCHGGKFKQAGLSLATRETLVRGSDNGPVVLPGNAKESLLVKKIKHEHEPGMPYQGKKLPAEVIDQMVEWINMGAPYDEALKMPASTESLSKLPTSEHWAFKPPRRPAVPSVKDRAWVRNPIDAFIAAEHEKKGLRPLGAADKHMLLRRVSLDLTGLPPTRNEIRAFLADTSPNAYDKVVDRLLASPQYGERWGRHWMDVWRYSDWYGSANEIRNSQQYIWHWREWIIDSLNQDKGYDRMILEMFAADELAPTDSKNLAATGYLARNWFRFNRNVTLQDTVEHTASAFLGLTFRCARCHDHKYDPIAQDEYYRLRAFFEPFDARIDRVAGSPDLSGVRRRLRKTTRAPSDEKDGLPRVYDAEPREPLNEEPFIPAIFPQTYRFIRGDERNPDKEHPLAPAVPEIFGNNRIKIEPVTLPLEAYYPSLRPEIHDDLIAEAKAEISKAEANLAKANQALVQARKRLVLEPSEGNGASGSAAGSTGPDFQKEIKPVLEKNCFFCHGPGKEKSGLNLETEETIQQGGTLNGSAAIPRNSSRSPLILYLRGEKKPRMPLGGPGLPEEEIKLIASWIDSLPEDEPKVALRKAEDAVALGEKELAGSRAHLEALQARIAADRAKYASPPDPNAEALAQSARKAERQASLLHGEEEILRAQQKLSEALSQRAVDEKADKSREKKVAAARKQLETAQAALGQATENYTPLGKVYPKTSTGRRLALARWIANQENPLTARVAINHIWLRHFGKALVPTVSNFGRNGRPPTHPELLDWLACEFMDKNWSMKSIHRLIMTSNTYRMQSAVVDPKHPNLAIDSENRYLWHMNPRRMEAEAVRDSMLYVAGELDLTIGGPDLDENMGEVYRRRSLYFKSTPDAQMTFLKLFDVADPRDCYERNESIVPQQALALSNSRLSRTMARLLARRLGSPSETRVFIEAAYETILGRLPSATEQSESEQFLRHQAELLANPEKLTTVRTGTASEIPPSADPATRAREDLVHVLLNNNEFVVIR
jgi:mono/diheme cytochrome c family protein